MKASRALHRRWETNTRYYETIVTTDLWGECVLLTCWGGKSNRLGAWRTAAIGEENINKKLIRIQDERLKHGYAEVTKGSGDQSDSQLT